MFRATIFLLAGVLSYLVTGWLVTAPAWFRSLDVPNVRSSHTQPTPRMGGLGIVASFVIILPMLWVMLIGASANWLLAMKFGFALDETGPNAPMTSAQVDAARKRGLGSAPNMLKLTLSCAHAVNGTLRDELRALCWRDRNSRHISAAKS